VAEIIARAGRLFPAEGPVEVSLEANPSRAEADRFAAFAAAGVQRLSLGVQSFEDQDLAFLGRDHDAAAVRGALGLAAAAFPRLSLDLIWGLPGRGPADLESALAQAAASGAEHVSAYELTIEAGTPFARAAARGRLVPIDPELGAVLFETKERVLRAEGFEAYEISSHARGAAARCRHNLLYWRGEEVLGIGPGAHGRIRTREGWRAQETERSLRAYTAKVAATGRGLKGDILLSARERAEERLMMGLRTLEGVPLADLEPLPLTGAAELEAEGFVRRAGGRLTATHAGRLVLNALIERLAL
jgi:oxygen-independent coproporphyrinogen-3 oxidase